MIAFDNIDNFRPVTELCSIIPQRYVYEDPVDLRSKRSNDSLEQFQSPNLTATTLYHSLDIKIEQLNLNRIQLLEKRKEIHESLFLFFKHQ